MIAMASTIETLKTVAITTTTTALTLFPSNKNPNTIKISEVLQQDKTKVEVLQKQHKPELVANADTTAHFNDFNNQALNPNKKTQKKDFSEQKEGGSDEFAEQLKIFISAYKNSKNPKIINAVNRFNELITKNLANVDHIKRNIDISIQIMLSPNYAPNLQDLEYIAFCEKMNQKLPNLNINTQKNKVVAHILKRKAERIPLNQLKHNPTFGANFNDAKNLQGKSVELTAGGKGLDEDGKIMSAMEQYYYFKDMTSTVDIQDMRNFLIFMTGDISYDDADKTTDEFVVGEYLRIMAEQEKLFQNTANIVGDEEYDDEDL